mmetsp:Transcript_30473/g.41288  ORF Transcript_30473/g.41288 Transcript_30473/m.41288 type:complete len:100 (-) Transcript_30473:454-753(-)
MQTYRCYFSGGSPTFPRWLVKIRTEAPYEPILLLFRSYNPFVKKEQEELICFVRTSKPENKGRGSVSEKKTEEVLLFCFKLISRSCSCVFFEEECMTSQ